MFLYRCATSLAVLLVFAGCARHAPVPPPSAPINLGPDWGHVTKTSDCVVNGGLPDAGCTPGNINPALTKDVICGPDFHTRDYRDKESTAAQKSTTYGLYNIPRPTQNTGANQQCELDHLVSLEVGGADDLSNIWPECTAGYAGWDGASFRDKDKFENYLRRMVCSGGISLADAQAELATDWYQYWVAAGKPRR
jgi:hypothetical protein